MLKQQIEYQVLQIADRVKAGQPIEDSLVELKREWVEPKKAARQIAGHANAARGEPILWIIGIDEKAQAIVGASTEELANWWPRVQAEFDGGTTPDLLYHLNVTVDGEIVAALKLGTDRAPYVIMNPNRCDSGAAAGPFHREVPWRDGTLTRSAHRSELLRILVPTSRLPRVEPLRAELSSEELGPSLLVWMLRMRAYVEPIGESRIIIPFHRCFGTVELTGLLPKHDVTELQVHPLYADPPPLRTVVFGQEPVAESLSETIRATRTEAIFSGPGMAEISGRSTTQILEVPDDAVVEVDLHLGCCGFELPITIKVRLERNALAAAGTLSWLWRPT